MVTTSTSRESHECQRYPATRSVDAAGLEQKATAIRPELACSSTTTTRTPSSRGAGAAPVA
jgi:hypothetical protein